MDVLTREQRSRCMSAIRGKHTKPELLVRLALRTMGFRYRLHPGGLSGKPDIVFSKQRVAVFVHGCFWHSHRCRYGSVTPATNIEFWRNKRLGTIERDKRNLRILRKGGWKVITVWECWTRKPIQLAERLAVLFGGFTPPLNRAVRGRTNRPGLPFTCKL
jgi:DNA mismatch endonuclease (patch repair protein)